VRERIPNTFHPLFKDVHNCNMLIEPVNTMLIAGVDCGGCNILFRVLALYEE
jgi:hypothetical protein